MNLSKNEFMLVVDATNGLYLVPELGYKTQIMADAVDSMHLDGTDSKWSVNRDELSAKLQAGTEPEYKELWKQIQDFWEKNDRESNA